MGDAVRCCDDAQPKLQRGGQAVVEHRIAKEAEAKQGKMAVPQAKREAGENEAAEGSNKKEPVGAEADVPDNAAKDEDDPEFATLRDQYRAAQADAAKREVEPPPPAEKS